MPESLCHQANAHNYYIFFSREGTKWGFGDEESEILRIFKKKTPGGWKIHGALLLWDEKFSTEIVGFQDFLHIFASSLSEWTLFEIKLKKLMLSFPPFSPTAYLENYRLALWMWNLAENRIHDVEKLLPRKLCRRIAIKIIDKIVQEKICACGKAN
jgi:hypothetical protein